jgi:cobalt-precorrin 5A hydrolase
MIVIGIGANSRAQGPDFIAAISDVRRAAGGCDAVATYGEAAFAHQVEDAAWSVSQAFAPISLEALRARNGDCATRSDRTMASFGVASIAEAAALAGAGEGSRLIMPRRIVGNITVAAAQSGSSQGQPR